MEILLLAGVVLLGSVVESAFAWLLAGRPEPDSSSFDARTEDRYSRLHSDFEDPAVA